MQLKLKAVLVTLLVVSCGGKDSRYRDTEMLERPPKLAIDNSINEPAIEPDISVVPKKTGKPGLRDAVSMAETEPLTIKIKQAYDDAWRNVGLALKQNDIKITDHNRERGLYYIYYASKGLLDIFKRSDDSQQDANFIVKLELEAGVVQVTARQVGPTEDDDNDKTRTSDQESLMRDLFDMLHDGLKEE